METYIPGIGSSGCGGLVWGWHPCSSAVTSLLIFTHHTWVWDHPGQLLRPSYQSQCGFFFNSLVVALPFNLISGGSEWWCFCTLAVILMWLWEEATTALTYTAILTRSPTLPSFKLGCCLFLLLCCKSYFYILDTRSPSDTCFANIFSHSVGCLFTFLIVFFDLQKCL